jgi:hypothetical protein
VIPVTSNTNYFVTFDGDHQSTRSRADSTERQVFHRANWIGVDRSHRRTKWGFGLRHT